MKRPFCIRALASAIGVCILSFGTVAHANIVTLSDLNSTATFDTQSSAGQFSWLVDGVEQIATQWFWYRLGNNPEQSVDALGQTNISVLDTNFNPGVDKLTVQYADNQLEVTLSLLLAGSSPGSGQADIAEQIAINNLSQTVQTVNFFQYVDFNLNGTPGGDTVTFTNDNDVEQTDGPVTVTETVITPAALRREANLAYNTLNALNAGVATNLSNFTGPLTGPDVTWAFQWEFVLAPGQQVLISKDKHIIVPEPTAGLLLFGLATGAVIFRRRPVLG